ncbi:hypothetical protein Pmani_002755 [Petrolisthes manimaculis]|uniref:Uncharacterized protein n=1 Tax=Petrolisthes manimaculis TaxID=1843537 RepID=A0AAE1QJT8_9EUCA|nr:hypothetical protein Pmani_002755 [Petrolisthes manimaculis]
MVREPKAKILYRGNIMLWNPGPDYSGDGTHVHTISTHSIRHPFSLVIYKDWLYVTDWRCDAILRMNKTDGSQERVVAEVAESNRLYGIRILYTVFQLRILPLNTHVMILIIEKGFASQYLMGLQAS